jgi:hypothetical protein
MHESTLLPVIALHCLENLALVIRSTGSFVTFARKEILCKLTVCHYETVRVVKALFHFPQLPGICTMFCNILAPIIIFVLYKYKYLYQGEEQRQPIHDGERVR